MVIVKIAENLDFDVSGTLKKLDFDVSGSKNAQNDDLSACKYPRRGV